LDPWIVAPQGVLRRPAVLPRRGGRGGRAPAAARDELAGLLTSLIAQRLGTRRRSPGHAGRGPRRRGSPRRTSRSAASWSAPARASRCRPPRSSGGPASW